MGRNRRTRPGPPPGAPPPAPTHHPAPARPAPKSAWRARIDEFGGPLVIGSIAAALLIVVALIVMNRPRSTANMETYVPRAHSQLAGRVSGKPDAPVKIVEYADFQCPFCHQHWRDVEPMLERDYIATGIITYEYKHLIVVSAESRDAAAASQCALDQGLFWEYHDILFLRQGDERSGVYTRANLKSYATQMASALPTRQFDQSKFDTCVDSGSKYPEVDAMTAEAGTIGTTSTPSFTIGGRLVQGALPAEQFRNLIEQARAGR